MVNFRGPSRNERNLSFFLFFFPFLEICYYVTSLSKGAKIVRSFFFFFFFVFFEPFFEPRQTREERKSAGCRSDFAFTFGRGGWNFSWRGRYRPTMRIPLQYFSTISPFVLVTKLPELVAQRAETAYYARPWYGLIGESSWISRKPRDVFTSGWNPPFYSSIEISCLSNEADIISF